MKSYHPDIFDDGLSVLAGNANLKQVVTAGVPATVTEASTAYPSGKRVSSVIDNGSLSITDGTGGTRKINTGAKSGAVAVTVSGEDLHVVLYDDTRVLVVNDELSDQALTEGNPISIPSFSIGFGQPE
jgi:hypothetical protein